MGQKESTLHDPGAGNQGMVSDDWRFTFRTILIERRALSINKDQYQFGKELGSGAFGAVYSARKMLDNKPVAVKIISLATLSGGEADMLVQSILTEIEMSKRLSSASKHVVYMYDFDFHSQTGLAFLVMELGEQDLGKLLSERSRLSPAERKDVWRQLVDIALVLHKNHIVHLDIKPQNLVVFPRGKIKLVDLGIAQKAYQRSFGSNGTWLYSAPEVTNAPRHQMSMHTSKADVWSWGAVLYRITYLVAPDYKPPCHHPPKKQHASRDSNLIDILRHTLVLDPRARPDPPWLAQHPYTTTP